MTPEQINARLRELEAEIHDIKTTQLALDLTRGKPSNEQLDLGSDLLHLPNGEYRLNDGIDCRNYGGFDGLPELRRLFAGLLGVTTEEIVIGGNSSLQLMHQVIGFAHVHGMLESDKPWGQQSIKFLCPVPGYDRHFSICEHFNIEMVNVPMTPTGPDMDVVEELVASDASIKGMWCVPKYSNPTGTTYSDETVTRLARMPTAAEDFKLFWDNAYIVHHLNGDVAELKNIHAACRNFDKDNRVIEFCSTSKLTFAGAGVSAVASSVYMTTWLKKHVSYMTIGNDKLNQLRHMHYIKDLDGLKTIADKHATILKPKFDAVQHILTERLGGKTVNGQPLCDWTTPEGGYFVSFNTQDGLAKRIVAMTEDLGVKLTRAGATFPKKHDPDNKNIRIAPSYPSLEDVRNAMHVFATCVEYVTLGKSI